MTTLTEVANEASVPETTLTRLFFEAIDKYGEQVAFERFVSEGELAGISYRETLRIVKGIVSSLSAQGVEPW